MAFDKIVRQLKGRISVNKNIVSVRNLCYSYGGEREVLKGINVDFKVGQRVAVVGTNGAGKSTFFLNLNGVLEPDGGEIIFHGKKMTRSKEDLMEMRRGIGIVFQDADNQIIATTVMGEVSFGPMNLRLPKEKVLSRVNEALEYMNIMSFKDRAPHYLSGGEKKRVTIADIIAMHSEVIIFDEPTAALDPANVAALETVLDKLNKQGKTILISTHDLDFAYRWAERVIVFCDGKIIDDGKPEEVFAKEEILSQANLKKPTMLEVREALVAYNVLKANSDYPKDVDHLKEILKG
ncbi:MAG: ATP-binding cassette domain-containing protein [Acidaminococcaceae bacterium]|nr:ATP-binding cassette domain-containing protein [Acidaminococcaceae bacterium]